MVSTPSRLKAAGSCFTPFSVMTGVSTHSRLKAAGHKRAVHRFARAGFNTQPPEGGWIDDAARYRAGHVSTHSRLKAAGTTLLAIWRRRIVSTHSRLKAAGQSQGSMRCVSSGFNTQPPEGGWIRFATASSEAVCFNTQPPEGGWYCISGLLILHFPFQHTAA